MSFPRVLRGERLAFRGEGQFHPRAQATASQAPPATDGWFEAPEILAEGVERWLALTKVEFGKAFRKTPVGRARFDGFRRNLQVVQRNVVRRNSE